MLRALLVAFFALAGASAQCTLTGVTITLGTPNVITFTSSSGAGCPGSGGTPMDVTAANAIPANAIATGQDGTRGVQGSAATVDPSGNGSFPGFVQSGAGSGKTGTLESTSAVSGHTIGFAAPDALASDYLYLPSASPSANGYLQDLGIVPCPVNMPPGAPTGCRQLGTTTPTGGTGGGSGALVLLEEHMAANSNTLPFTGCFSATYDEYEIHLNQIVPSIDNARIGVQLSADGGATFDTTTGHYSWFGYAIVAAATGTNGSASDSAIYFDNGETSGANSTSTSGRFTIFGPGGSLRKNLFGSSIGWDSSGTRLIGYTVGGSYLQTGPMNAFRIIPSSGVLASGDARCYGVAR